MAKTPSLSHSRIERWYGKLVALFVCLAIILIGFIVYFSFTKTTITIAAEPRTETVEFTTSLSDMKGVVLLTDVEGSKTVAVEKKTEAETAAAATQKTTPTIDANAKAKGTVTIVNKYTADQPLVQGTRLMSKEQVLFRTTKTVTVPKGGSVTVDIEADQPGEKGIVPATSFEIVALWSGLKEKIYATSEKSTSASGTTGTTPAPTSGTIVTQNDIANAKTLLQTDLFEKANARFDEEAQKRDELKTVNYRIATPVVTETLKDEQTPAAGETAEELTVTQKLTVATAMLDKETLENAINAKITEQMGNITINKADGYPLNVTTITMSDVKESLTDATLRVSVEVPVTMTAEDKKIDKTKLTNKTPEDIQKYLLTFDDVKSVDVRLSPFWANRTPSISDSITIVVTTTSPTNSATNTGAAVTNEGGTANEATTNEPTEEEQEDTTNTNVTTNTGDDEEISDEDADAEEVSDEDEASSDDVSEEDEEDSELEDSTDEDVTE